VAQGVDEQIGIVPAVKPELHFVQVGLQMLRAEAMPRSHKAALEQRERGFDGVRVDVAVNVNAVLVPNRFVLFPVNPGFNHGLRIGNQFIGDDYVYVGADVLLDVLRQRSTLGIFGMEETEIATALPNSDYDLLVGSASSFAARAVNSTDVGFVHFDSTVQHRPLDLGHRSTYAMAEIPCGLVRTLVITPKGALELQRAHALLGFAEQQRSGKPNRERQVGIVEDCPRRDREVIFALGTVELFVSLNPRDARAVASRTLDAIGPAQLGERFPAFRVGVEQVLNL